jgi:endoglucanase
MSRISFSMLIAVAGFLLLDAAPAPAAYNYGEALQKAIYFYECQESGQLPASNRVSWRGPSCLNDGKDAGHDLTGGWFDAGDHVKFNFPMAFSVTMLSWGIVENRAAYEKSGQLAQLLANIRFTTDYLIKCHTAPNEFYGQVGDGGSDHSFWGPAESVESMTKRPSSKIDAAHPGSDLAGEAAAALAAASIVFAPTDPAYAAVCLTHAKQLYAFADQYRGKYDAAITGASGYYNSWSGYKDELVWGALWLYRASNDPAYLAKAESSYDSLNTEPQSTTRSYKWTIAWDDKSYGCYVLLAALTGKQKYKDDAERWLNYWTTGVDGQKIKYTPGGLAWLDQWGSCRYAANTAFCALVYGDLTNDATLKARYHDFALKQINYMLGDNPMKRSLVVGYGVNPPCHEHHRTAEGSYPGDASDTVACVHTLYGALVGGPGASDDYTDQRNNYTVNEVACDYNAGFTCALARLYKEYGGDPLSSFPPKEKRLEQFYVMANVNASGDRFTEIKAVLCNKTNQPARVCKKLSYKYFMNLSEAKTAGINVSDITVRTNYLQGKAKISPLTAYNGSSDIYFVEISYYEDSLLPGTQDSYKREAQFRIELPQNATAAAWNTANDWSYKTVGASGQSAVKAINMPIYDNGVQIWGAEPDKDPVEATRPPVTLQTAMKKSIEVAIVNGAIRVTNAGRQNLSVSITDLSGRIIRKMTGKGDLSISVKSVGAGTRVCVVKAENGEMVIRKIVCKGE